MGIRSTNKDLNINIKAKNLASKVYGTAIQDLQKFWKQTEKMNKGQKTQLSDLNKRWSGLSTIFKNIGSIGVGSLGWIRKGLKQTINTVFSLKSAIIALSAGFLGFKGIKSFLELNASFEKMEIIIDALTEGEGEQWFKKINEWALKMPVSTQAATQAFSIMRAYGLEPSLEMMEQIVDVSAALPDSARAMSGIARAIGQIAAKGRLEGQEMRQLAEWAVPAYAAVFDKIFKVMAEKTGKTMAEFEFTMIDADTAIKALLEGMGERFGGMTERIGKTFGGLMIVLKGFWIEFWRLVGKSKVMETINTELIIFVGWLQKALDTGLIKEWANIVGTIISKVLKSLISKIKVITSNIDVLGDKFLQNLEKIIYTVTLVGSIFDGWRMIFLVIKKAFIDFVMTPIWTGLNKIREGVTEVIGIYYDMANALPDSIPGINKVREAFMMMYVDSIVVGEEQKTILEGLKTASEDTGTTLVDVAKRTTDRFDNAAAAVHGVRTNLEMLLKVPKGKEIFGPPVPAGFKPPKPELEVPIPEVGEPLFKSLKQWEDYYLRTEGIRAGLVLGFIELSNTVANVGETTMKALLTFASTLQSGFSSTFQGILDGSLNFKESWQGILKSMETAFFQAISNMAAEWLTKRTMMLAKEIYFNAIGVKSKVASDAIKTASTKAAAVTSVATTATAAGAEIKMHAATAAAGAAKSQSSIPGIGPILAISAAIAMLAFVTGLAKFDKGTGLKGVGETGPAVVHKGEIILTKKESDVFREILKDREGVRPNGGGIMNVSFNINAMDGEDVERIVRKKVIPILKDNIRDFGQMRMVVGEAT